MCRSWLELPGFQYCRMESVMVPDIFDYRSGLDFLSKKDYKLTMKQHYPYRRTAMKQRILTLMTALALLLASMPGSAFYYSWGRQTFANATLHEGKIIAVNAAPPIRSMNGKLMTCGVSDIELEKKISQRLRDAGFNIISTEQALAYP